MFYYLNCTEVIDYDTKKTIPFSEEFEGEFEALEYDFVAKKRIIQRMSDGKLFLVDRKALVDKKTPTFSKEDWQKIYIQTYYETFQVLLFAIAEEAAECGYDSIEVSLSRIQQYYDDCGLNSRLMDKEQIQYFLEELRNEQIFDFHKSEIDDCWIFYPHKLDNNLKVYYKKYPDIVLAYKVGEEIPRWIQLKINDGTIEKNKEITEPDFNMTIINKNKKITCMIGDFILLTGAGTIECLSEDKFLAIYELPQEE